MSELRASSAGISVEMQPSSSTSSLEALSPYRSIQKSQWQKTQASGVTGFLGRAWAYLVPKNVAATGKLTRENFLSAITSAYPDHPELAQKVESLVTRSSWSKTSLSERTIAEALNLVDAEASQGAKPGLTQVGLTAKKQAIREVALKICPKQQSVDSSNVDKENLLESADTRSDSTSTASSTSVDTTDATTSLSPKEAAKQIKQTMHEELKQLNGRLQAAGKPPISEKDFKELMKSPEVLNRGNWATMNKTILARDSGLQQDYKTTLVPASESSALATTYQKEGIKGVASVDKKNSNHAVNLWHQQATNSQGKEIVSFLRSGVTAPTGSEHDKKSVDAAKPPFTEATLATANARLNENLLMALESSKNLPSKSPTEGTPGHNAKNPIELPLADIGLLSGSNLYNMGKEATMLQDQFEFLGQVNNQARPITYTPKGETESVTIYVKPQIVAFNFGVQLGDREGLGYMSTSTASKNPNEASLDALIGNDPIEQTEDGKTSWKSDGLVANYLNKPDITAEDKQVVQELAWQIREMRTAGVNADNDKSYYAFASRVTLLCHKIGITPMVHCKSGKDRTGSLAAEVIKLASQIDDSVAQTKQSYASGSTSGGREDQRYRTCVPLAGLRSYSEERADVAFGLGVGNKTIQELCTGNPGNKQAWQYGQRVNNIYAVTANAGEAHKSAT